MIRIGFLNCCEFLVFLQECRPTARTNEDSALFRPHTRDRIRLKNKK